MHHQYGLLFDTLDWYKSHCRRRDSLADRFGVRGIVLVPRTYAFTKSAA
jgi:hypothetical protein